MDLGEIGRKGVDWMHLAQDRNHETQRMSEEGFHSMELVS